MKQFFLFFVFVGFSGFANLIFSQTWQNIYFLGQNTIPWSLMETQDRGYVIGGTYYNSNGWPTFGSVLKIDVNGSPIWNKYIGSINYSTGIYSIRQTSDGGYILTGAQTSVDPDGDTFFAKVDPCFNLEWCRHYSSNYNQFDYGRSIYEVPGGYMALVKQFGNDIINKRIWLFKLNESGEIIWEQYYTQSDTLINSEIGYGMIVTKNQEYIINGDCYYPDSGGIAPIYLRPLIIKVDSTGEVFWETPWSKINGVSFLGESFKSIADNKNCIYSCGRHIESNGTPPGDRPTMLKTDSAGNEIAYFDIFNNSWQAIASTINWFQDSSIAIGGGWAFSPGDTVHNGVFKITRQGVVLKSKYMFENDWTFNDAVTTSDNKILLIAGLYTNMWTTYAWKLNSDLEYDTLYTHPFVYDSLCPHPIASDTILLDCVVVGINEPFENPQTGRLKVYPNPASDILHLEIPQQLKSVTQSPVFNLTTVYHQWKSAMLEVYNLFGEKVYSGEVRQPDNLIDLGVAGWGRGMYVVRLVYNGKTVASEKVLIK